MLLIPRFFLEAGIMLLQFTNMIQQRKIPAEVEEWRDTPHFLCTCTDFRLSGTNKPKVLFCWLLLLLLYGSGFCSSSNIVGIFVLQLNGFVLSSVHERLICHIPISINRTYLQKSLDESEPRHSIAMQASFCSGGSHTLSTDLCEMNENGGVDSVCCGSFFASTLLKNWE